MDDERSRLFYRCLAGHEIDADRLEEGSEIVEMDAGARVRICREHGCPVAISRPALRHAEDNR
jgi:hypothetical protein